MSFGLGTQLFGSTNEEGGDGGETSDVPDEPPASETEESDSEEEADPEDEQSEIEVMEAAEASPEWQTYPSYKPVYLSTESEYVPPVPKAKVKAEKYLDEEDVGEGKKEKGGEWGFEGWEKSVDVDGVFEKFTKRVSYEPEQCVRCVRCLLFNNAWIDCYVTAGMI